MHKRAFLYFCSVLALAPATAFAHDTWLAADQTQVAPKQFVTLNLTSGMAFPALEVGPKRERVEAARCRLAGRTFEVTDLIVGPKSLVFKSEVPEAGVATFWVKLPPKSIELKPEQVQEYLEEIDAPADVRKQWAETKEPKHWRELYSKHTKVFVRVGEPPRADRSWSEPVGTAFEIVPEKDPTALRAGDDLPVQVLKNGAPFADFALNALTADESKGETRRTDTAGRVTFRLSKAGRWLFRGIDVRKSSHPEADYESDFTTLTLEVVQNR